MSRKAPTPCPAGAVKPDPPPAPPKKVPRTFRVGVFEHQRPRGIRLEAYTLWYNPAWPGCCEHVVFATSGADAKKLAKQEHRERCMSSRSS